MIKSFSGVSIPEDVVITEHISTSFGGDGCVVYSFKVDSVVMRELRERRVFGETWQTGEIPVELSAVLPPELGQRVLSERFCFAAKPKGKGRAPWHSFDLMISFDSGLFWYCSWTG